MKFLFILIIITTIASCDPYQLVYVNNYTASSVEIEVHHKKQAADFDNFMIHSADSIYLKPKLLLKHRYEKTLSVFKINDTCYKATLPAKSSSQLCPLSIGFPIHAVIINGNSVCDSIFFDNRLKKKISKAKVIGLQKVNWSFYIYHLK